MIQRVAVTGGRKFDDRERVVRALEKIPRQSVLVHGAANGADSLAAEVWDGAQESYPANWTGPCRALCPPGHRRRHPGSQNDYCPWAGLWRNQDMVDSRLDLLLAFPGGRGTADMVRRCEDAGVLVIMNP